MRRQLRSRRAAECRAIDVTSSHSTFAPALRSRPCDHRYRTNARVDRSASGRVGRGAKRAMRAHEELLRYVEQRSRNRNLVVVVKPPSLHLARSGAPSAMGEASTCDRRGGARRPEWGATRPALGSQLWASHLAGRPPFGQPHTRRFHFAPAKTRPPPAPSGWPSNEGRAVVSGTWRIGRCRLCGGARAGFGGGGVGGRRLPNLRRGRVWSI